MHSRHDLLGIACKMTANRKPVLNCATINLTSREQGTDVMWSSTGVPAGGEGTFLPSDHCSNGSIASQCYAFIWQCTSNSCSTNVTKMRKEKYGN